MRGENSVNPAMKTEVECFPLFSILLAIGNPQIDLFSLDIEGIIRSSDIKVLHKYENLFAVKPNFTITSE